MIKKQKTPNKILSGKERIGELFTAEARVVRKNPQEVIQVVYRRIFES
jgi:hypothetical protein